MCCSFDRLQAGSLIVVILHSSFFSLFFSSVISRVVALLTSGYHTSRLPKMKSIQIPGLLLLLAQLSPSIAQLDMVKKHQFGMKQMGLNDGHQAILDDDDLIVLGAGTFDQLLDHSDPGKGTFKQRYWWNAEFFEEE